MQSNPVVSRLKIFLERLPSIHESVYRAPGAHIIGDVRLGPRSSVWPTAVLRADINFIEVGEGSNFQEAVVCHLSDEHPLIVGNYVTVGHGAILHACHIEDECLVGMHATILDGAKIGRQSIVAAGTVVPPNMQVPEGSMLMGVPAKLVRSLSLEERAKLKNWADRYVASAEYYKEKASLAP